MQVDARCCEVTECPPQCQQSMARAVATEETLGIEYDEQTTCDVCRDVSLIKSDSQPLWKLEWCIYLAWERRYEWHDILWLVQCLCASGEYPTFDQKNWEETVYFSQACYGIPMIPYGEWLCRVCSARDKQARCILCPIEGGALKRVRPGNSSWAHLCCALWIPEVRVGNADKMEPITNIDAIPVSDFIVTMKKEKIKWYPKCIPTVYSKCGVGSAQIHSHEMSVQPKYNLLAQSTYKYKWKVKNTLKSRVVEFKSTDDATDDLMHVTYLYMLDLVAWPKLL